MKLPTLGCSKSMLLFLDTETTGKSRINDRLVQLAWTLTNMSGEVLSTRSSIVKPDGFTIPADAAKIHRITTDTAREKGIPLSQCLEQLVTLKDQVRVLIAHNIEFDTGILKGEFKRVGLDYPYNSIPTICTMESSVEICKLPKPYGKPGLKWPKLEELHLELFGRSFANAHDADADVQACMRCFFSMLKNNFIKIPESAYQQKSTPQKVISMTSVADFPVLKDIGITFSDENSRNNKSGTKTSSNKKTTSPNKTPETMKKELIPKKRRSKSNNLFLEKEAELYWYVRNLPRDEQELARAFLESKIDLHLIKWAKNKKPITFEDFYLYSYTGTPERDNDCSGLFDLMCWTASAYIQTLDQSIDNESAYEIGIYLACEWLLKIIKEGNDEIQKLRARYGDWMWRITYGIANEKLREELLGCTSDLWRLPLSSEVDLIRLIFEEGGLGLELRFNVSSSSSRVKKELTEALLNLSPLMRAAVCSVFQIPPTNELGQIASDEDMAQVAQLSRIERKNVVAKALRRLRYPSVHGRLSEILPSKSTPILEFHTFGEVFFDAILAHNKDLGNPRGLVQFNQLVSQLNEVEGPFVTQRKDLNLADKKALMNVSLDQLNLTVRTVNCLKVKNILTIADLVKFSEVDILNEPRMGRVSLGEIKEILGMLGLQLDKSSSK